MQTKAGPENRPKTGKPWVPPRGIRFFHRAGRPKPFFLEWREKKGEPARCLAFADEVSRDLAGKKLAEERAEHGTIALSWHAEGWREYLEAKATVGDVDLRIVAHEWAQGRASLPAPVQSLGIEEAVQKYRAAMRGTGASADSVAQRDLQLERLVAAFPRGTLADLTAEALCGWLATLSPPRAGGVAAPRTKRAHRGTVARLLDYAVGAGWLTRSPMAAVPVPVPESEDVAILTVDQARKLFATARGTRCAARLALEAFGGLRFSSAQRIARADLASDVGGITFPAAKHKTGKRHYVEGFPANLWAWVAAAPAECWELTPRLYAMDKRTVFEAADLKGVGKDAEALRNCLRHSFATYHLAAHRDAAKTAYLLTHSNPTMLYQHYAGRAKQADGLEYFGIIP